jgi:hypothetical protein
MTMLTTTPVPEALFRIAMPRPPRGPGDGDDDELPMGDPPDDDETDDQDDEDEGEEDDEPLHTRPDRAASRE